MNTQAEAPIMPTSLTLSKLEIDRYLSEIKKKNRKLGAQLRMQNAHHQKFKNHSGRFCSFHQA